MNKKCIVLLMSVVSMLGGLFVPAGPVRAADCVTDAEGNVVCVNDGTISTVGASDYGLVAQSSGIGSATAINNGTVAVDRTAVYANATGSGDATATNNGSVTVANNGMVARAVSGSATATNSGVITANRYGLYATSASGDVTVTNAFTGAITSNNYDTGALWAESPGTGTLSANNAGTVYSAGQGLWVRSTGGGEVSAINSGRVDAVRTGLWVETTTGSADVTAMNSGTIVSGRSGMVARNGGSGDVTLTNSGDVFPQGYGLQAWATGGGSVTVTNSGVVDAYNTAIWVETPSGGTVTNSGTAISRSHDEDISAVLTTDGNDVVINSGIVAVANDSYTERDVVGIQTAGGNDTVINSGIILAYDGVDSERFYAGTAIDTGTGNDTVIIQSETFSCRIEGGVEPVTMKGGTITGLIDGGDDWDRLAFSAVLDPASYEGLNAELQAQLASADPAGGTITFRGESYTYANFEELLNWLVLAMLHDGRINPFDFAATATGWCAGGGAQFYAIHADGTGEWAYNVTDGQVQVALADRSAAGVDQLQLMGPDYLTIFPANTCGFTD